MKNSSPEQSNERYITTMKRDVDYTNAVWYAIENFRQMRSAPEGRLSVSLP